MTFSASGGATGVFECPELETRQAKRVAHFLVTGTVAPPGKYVCVACDETLCLRHLLVGDSRRAGSPGRKHSRAKNAAPTASGRHGHHVKGSQHPRAKLTEDQVRMVRKLGTTEKIGVLARAFGLTSAGIRRILDRKVWAHIA